jgi:hypothetical protein
MHPSPPLSPIGGWVWHMNIFSQRSLLCWTPTHDAMDPSQQPIHCWIWFSELSLASPHHAIPPTQGCLAMLGCQRSPPMDPRTITRQQANPTIGGGGVQVPIDAEGKGRTANNGDACVCSTCDEALDISAHVSGGGRETAGDSLSLSSHTHTHREREGWGSGKRGLKRFCD